MKRPLHVSWKSETLISFSMSMNEVIATLGEPHQANVPMDGLGHFHVWLLTFPNRLEILVNAYPGWSERGDNYAPDEPAPVNVLANRTERGQLLFHLPLKSDAPCFAESCQEGPRDWILTRQDDNGNKFEVARYTSESEALHEQLKFESLGHKQVYWVSNV